MQGKKRSKVEHLASILASASPLRYLTPQTGDFDQKHRRCVNCRQTLRCLADKQYASAFHFCLNGADAGFAVADFLLETAGFGFVAFFLGNV